jgi:Asp-tRNA(Asn)/Glu-tRNA(Gln) amidotransferase A subunit family amidase
MLIDSSSTRVPMSDLTRLSASQVRPLLQQGTVTVEEYAKALLSRICQREPVVHAWAFLDPEFVLAQARKLDQIPPEKRGPLHGIPIAIKDVAHTNGRHKKNFCSIHHVSFARRAHSCRSQDMPTRYNSDIYRGSSQTSADAATVMTLRAHGALIFGKTHTTEFASTTDGGPCVNPHNPKHTPGGSSSGSAASVADFQAPIALGTQTGGSVVRPASYNGVYGFKVRSPLKLCRDGKEMR